MLKNALDLMGGDEFRGKVFGLLGVAGGSAGAVNTLGHLRVVVRGVGGWSLPVQISIPNVRSAFANGKLVDKGLEDRVRFLGRELVRFTRLHSMVPELELIPAWKPDSLNRRGCLRPDTFVPDAPMG